VHLESVTEGIYQYVEMLETIKEILLTCGGPTNKIPNILRLGGQREMTKAKSINDFNQRYNVLTCPGILVAAFWQVRNAESEIARFPSGILNASAFVSLSLSAFFPPSKTALSLALAGFCMI